MLREAFEGFDAREDVGGIPCLADDALRLLHAEHHRPRDLRHCGGELKIAYFC